MGPGGDTLQAYRWLSHLLRACCMSHVAAPRECIVGRQAASSVGGTTRALAHMPRAGGRPSLFSAGKRLEAPSNHGELRYQQEAQGECHPASAVLCGHVVASASTFETKVTEGPSPVIAWCGASGFVLAAAGNAGCTACAQCKVCVEAESQQLAKAGAAWPWCLRAVAHRAAQAPLRSGAARPRCAPACTQFVADGVFYAELNELLTQELAEDGYSGVEVRKTPMRTEIIIRATRTQNVLGALPTAAVVACHASAAPVLLWVGQGGVIQAAL